MNTVWVDEGKKKAEFEGDEMWRLEDDKTFYGDIIWFQLFYDSKLHISSMKSNCVENTRILTRDIFRFSSLSPHRLHFSLSLWQQGVNDLCVRPLIFFLSFSISPPLKSLLDASFSLPFVLSRPSSHRLYAGGLAREWSSVPKEFHNSHNNNMKPKIVYEIEEDEKREEEKEMKIVYKLQLTYYAHFNSSSSWILHNWSWWAHWKDIFFWGLVCADVVALPGRPMRRERETQSNNWLCLL